jgi:nicotinate-nucleotide adenylyltransferase
MIQLSLERVVWIPAALPPHKPVDDEPGIEHRLELCRLAINGDQRFAVSDLERRREGPSYTVDTLEELRSQMPDSEFFLIVGADVAAGFAGWREPRRVLELATVAVAARPGTSRAVVEDVLDRLAGKSRSSFFDMPVIGVSSTMLRDRVRAGGSTRYLMPDPVRSYIDQHHLYGGSQS